MSDKEKIEKAIEMLWNGSFDGDHHKMWVIDQTLRILLGDKYEEAIKEFQGPYDEENGWFEYEWDVGVPP